MQAVPMHTVPMQAVPVQAVPVQAVPMQAVPMQAVPAVPLPALAALWEEAQGHAVSPGDLSPTGAGSSGGSGSQAGC